MSAIAKSLPKPRRLHLYSALKLFILLVGFTALFYLSGVATLRDERRPTLSLGLAAGLLTAIICAMLTTNINAALLAQTSIAMFGIYRLYTSRQGNRTNPALQPNPSSWPQMTVFMVLIFIFSCILISDPIADWDARSIWFYHAKVIYYTKDIWAHGQWAEQANIYTHLNYPKLFPLLAAQVANAFGFWNEYIPKLAIALLACPILAFFVESALKTQRNHRAIPVNFLLLFMMLFMFDGAGFYLTSGYMDGWVALYSICASMMLTTAIQQHNSDDGRNSRIQALVFLAILSQIKQEGLIIAVILLAVAIAVTLGTLAQPMQSIKRISSGTTPKTLRSAAWYSLFLLGPVVAWLIASHIQGLSLSHYSGNTLERITTKLTTSGQPTWILANVIFHNGMIFPSLALALVLTVNAAATRKRLMTADFLPLIASLVFLVVIFLVYLATNADVNWHMAKSAGRVGLTPGLLIVCYNYHCIINILFADRSIKPQSSISQA